MRTWIATDVGGTFTDIVVCSVDENRRVSDVRFGKVPSTPPNFETGVDAAIRKYVPERQPVERFVHGSTVVINAITERKGAAVGLITTQGFRDVLEIGRGNRPDMFNINYTKPPVFVPRFLRVEVNERIGPDGSVIRPLDLSGLRSIVDHFRAYGVQSIAVCLLHSYANPVHEEKIVEYLARIGAGVPVVASHAVCRLWREYERTSTAVISAYVKPVLETYIERLCSLVEAHKVTLEFAFAMMSNGGLTGLPNGPQQPLSMVESGPAAGVIAAATMGRAIGEANVITIDVGGTTAKSALIEDSRYTIADDYHVEKTPLSAGYPIMTPVIDLVEIGNGGGSLLTIDAGGKLSIGPRSAGADPGPMCYGKGGETPTLTDAMVLIGAIDPNQIMGAARRADVPLIRHAFDDLGHALHLNGEEVAHAAFRLATTNIVNAIKLVSLNRGYDPRDFALMAFGGGGGFYAASVACELGMSRAIVPRGQEVFSAWGMLAADLRRDHVVTSLTGVTPHNAAEIEETFRGIEARAIAGLETEKSIGAQPVIRRYADMRYETQEFTVLVPWPSQGGADGNACAAMDRFHELHCRKFGFRLPNAIQIVSFKVVCEGILPKLTPWRTEVGTADRSDSVRSVWMEDCGPVQTRVVARDFLPSGACVRGPAVLENEASSILLPEHSEARVDEFGNVIVTLEDF